MTLSNYVLAASFVFAIVSGLSAPVIRDHIIYDDRLAMNIRNVKVMTPKIKKGEDFVYEFDYDKRRECFPPRGTGELKYRIWPNDNGEYKNFEAVKLGAASFADPEQHHRRNSVQVQALDPGLYMMQYQVSFTCQGASKDQHWDGPMMPFEVVK